MTWAIGLAAAQGCGMRETHATMAGGLVPALGARAGLAAALLAARGFDCGEAALEGAKGLLQVVAPGSDASLAVRDLGTRFELAELSYKPYPCGIVIHPAIDACLAVAPQAVEDPPESVRLRVHPLALRLTGTRHPPNALSCNVSLFHWCAAALVRGRAGLAEATEQALRDPGIAGLRERIEATADEHVQPDEAHAEVRLRSGRVLTHHVEHARGSRARPLTEDELGAKFLALAAPRLGATQAAELLALCDALPRADADWLDAFAALAVPR
jgi:2-methylcitrate dehydratase PrpD